jgi:hypothetical protein
MDRDELERDLVKRDKQSLISDCLRLFDTNAELVTIGEHQIKKILELENKIKEFGTELETVTNLSGPRLIGEGFKRIIGL